MRNTDLHNLLSEPAQKFLGILPTPLWVSDADLKTLCDIWLARYGTDWVSINDLEADYPWVASRLEKSNKLDLHRPAIDEGVRLRLNVFSDRPSLNITSAKFEG